MVLMLSYLTPSPWDHIPSVACAAIARVTARDVKPVPKVALGLKTSAQQPPRMKLHCGRAFVCALASAIKLHVPVACAAMHTCVIEKLALCVANTKKGSWLLTTNLWFFWWAIRDSNPEPTD